MNNRLISILTATILVFPVLCFGQSGGLAPQCFPTNWTADATNSIFTVPFAYSWISIQNDSATNVYMTPGLAYVNIVTTNFTFTGSGVYSNAVISNRQDVVTNSVAYTAALNKGTRLNANGGSVFYDNEGRPTKHDFQFIAATAGNNVCIEIGVAQQNVPGP